ANVDIDMIVNYDAAFDDNTNVNGEYVQLRNRGSERITLDGWLLRDTALRRFPLPSGYRIDPGDYVRIFVGVGTNGPRSIYLGQSSPLFGNDTDGVFLHDPDFDLRAFDIWPCTDTCVDPPQLTIDTVNANAPGDDNTNPNGEWVRIRNTGGVTVDFQDWMVDFPRFQITSIASRPLAPNETLTIFMGTGTNTGNEMYLGETDPTSAVLSNTNHIVVLYTPERTVADCDAAGTSVCPTILDVEDPDAMKSAVRIGNARRV
ncbi:MAG: lamin tail domain-containing protein, partial [Actinomycetota bacterium]